MKFTLTRDVEPPKRAHEYDAGLDFFCPKMGALRLDEMLEKNPTLTESNFRPDGIVLGPGQRVNIPSGVIVKVPENKALIAVSKSGVASKRGILFLASCVDHGYSGEVHINLVNVSNIVTSIKYGEKIIQFAMFDIDCSQPEYVNSIAELYPEKTERNSGGFGSTGI